MRCYWDPSAAGDPFLQTKDAERAAQKLLKDGSKCRWKHRGCWGSKWCPIGHWNKTQDALCLPTNLYGRRGRGALWDSCPECTASKGTESATSVVTLMLWGLTVWAPNHVFAAALCEQSCNCQHVTSTSVDMASVSSLSSVSSSWHPENMSPRCGLIHSTDLLTSQPKV